ncbi:MAG: hypothetical protein U0736_08065 [Gemmataceae bacterium]
MSVESLVVAPGPDERSVRTAAGVVLRPPADWVLLPPGDATLTRRVKAAGPTWTVQEKRGRKLFSRGVWAAAATVEAVRAALAAERDTPAYAKARAHPSSSASACRATTSTSSTSRCGRTWRSRRSMPPWPMRWRRR